MISKTNCALERSGKRADDGRQASNLVEDVVGPQKWMLCFPYGLGLDHHHMVHSRAPSGNSRNNNNVSVSRTNLIKYPLVGDK